MSIARPSVAILRNPLRNQLKKNVIIAVALTAVTGIGYKLICDWRKQKYVEFHKTWDNKRHYERMAAAGVFDSVKPGSSSETPQWVIDYEKEVDRAIAGLKK